MSILLLLGLVFNLVSSQKHKTQHAILIRYDKYDKHFDCVAIDSSEQFVRIGIDGDIFNPKDKVITSINGCSIFPIKNVGKSRFKIYSVTRDLCLTANPATPTWSNCVRSSKYSKQVWSKRLVNKSNKLRAGITKQQRGFSYDENSAVLELHILGDNSNYVKEKIEQIRDDNKKIAEKQYKRRVSNRKQTVLLIAFLASLLVCLFCLLLVILVLKFC